MGDDELMRESNPNASGPEHAEGGMGISSERTGPTGPGQESTDGTRDTAPPHPEELPDAAPPEQSRGNPERNPVGMPPKSGYSSIDPRSQG